MADSISVVAPTQLWRRPWRRLLAGLGSIEAIRRIVEIALFDVLGLENSIARARVLISSALAAAKLLETGELAERIAALEAALAQDRAVPPETLFPDESAP